MTEMNKTPYAFIPKQLEIENRHDLRVFPNKVVFMSYKTDDHGRLICGSSFYVPLLETLEQAADRWEMRYANEYGSDCWLRMIYYPESKSYRAEKYIRGELTIITNGGPDWKTFFIHLTMNGLQNSEKCVFDLPQKIRTMNLH